MTARETPMGAVVSALYRYPIKGFSGQRLTDAALEPGKGIAFDRFLGIANGNVVTPTQGWAACQGFVRMTRNDNLPLFDLAFDADRLQFALRSPGGGHVNVDMVSEQNLQAANHVIASWFPRGKLDVPRLVRRTSNLGWWDFEDATLSIINLETLRALSAKAECELDSLRFRSNLYIDGIAAWQEFQWVGQRIRIGEDVELEVVRPIERCKATSVDPVTADVNVNVPALLASKEGHVYCGVYARVVTAGRARVGDPINVCEPVQRATQMDAMNPMAPAPEHWPRFATIVRRMTESSDVASFWLRDPLAHLRSSPRPGQHLRIHLPSQDTKPFWRSYTISAVDGDLLRLSIKSEREYGIVSRRMHEAINENSALLISGPFGSFHLGEPDTNRPLILVSAGIGITPMVAMLRALASREDRSRPVLILHAARHRGALALWQEVLAIAKTLPHAKVRLFLSQPTDDITAIAHAEVGHMNASVFDGLRTTAEMFICGPGAFSADVRSWAVKAGIANEAIHSEAFASPSSTRCELQPPPISGPVRVRFARSGTETVWQRADGTLLELAEAAGLNLPANCRAGVCGACRQPLTSGEVFHMTEPPFPLGQHDVLTCCAVPLNDVEIQA